MTVLSEIRLGKLRVQLTSHGWLHLEHNDFLYGLLPDETYELYCWLQEQKQAGRLRRSERRRKRGEHGGRTDG